ncbi:MAG TPA: hypothetical protein VF053_04735 [Streptosporangiales bacterium]
MSRQSSAVRKPYPRTRREGVFFLLAVVAALATLWGLNGFDPDYSPYCGFRQMYPGQYCISASGGGSYEQMADRGRRHDRILFVLALPATVVFGALSGTEIRRRRRQNKALRSLVEARGWSLEPPDPEMPKQDAAAGRPLGLVTGRLDGRTIVVQRYAKWTHVAVNLTVAGLPRVTVGLDPASGRVLCTGAVPFGEQLATPPVRETMRRLAVTEFTVHRGAVSRGRPGPLPAADIDATVGALAAVAAALPVEALRAHARPVPS